MNFRKNEKTFIIACLVSFLFFGICLLVDVLKKYEILADGREGIGRIIFMHNDVSRRILPGAPWEALRPGSPVMDNDAIITGVDSSAGIALKDGTLAETCEDSVVTFERSDGGVRLIIEKGCADVTRKKGAVVSGSSLVIASGDKEITLGEGALSIAKPAGSDPEMFVRSGRAGVSINGDRRTLDAGEFAVLKPDTLAVEKKTLILSDPSENKHLFTSQEAAQVEFAWEYKGKKTGDTMFLVEISRNQEFSSGVRRIKSSDEMIAEKMAEGDYFWRVSLKKDENGPRETSETGRFSVYRDRPFALLGPTDGETVTYKEAPPMIAFSWEPHRLAASYILEISERRNFSHVLKRFDSRVVNFSCQWDEEMKPGDRKTVYWRVTATGSLRGWRGRRSGSRRIVVTRGDRLSPPRLVYPLDGKNMSRSRVDKEHIVFSWEKTEDTVRKKILFARDRDFSAVYREMPVNTNHWTMGKAFPSGRYFWRVALHDEDGNRKAVSETRLFELRDYEDLVLLSPSDMARLVIDDVEKKGVSFAWKRSAPQGRFIIETSDDRNFSTISNSIGTKAERTTVDRLKPGIMYWRVKQLNDENAVIAASGTRAFTIRGGIAPPVVLFPRSGGAVKMLKENELNFSWKPSRWANAYQLELHQLVKEKHATRDKLVLSTQTKDPKYTVSDLNLLDVGNFYWTLKAVKKDSRGRVIRSSRKVRNDFNINLGESKIIIISPEVQVIEDDTGD